LPQKEIVVIGGSAGALESLMTIVAALPAGFPASIFVVIHRSSDFPSMLANLLSTTGPLLATNAVDGQVIKPGRIYVAVPDNHLTIEHSRVRVVRGPRENRHRPAIDPLFRSAAREYGPRVIGVLLSGLRDDGSAGLFAIKQRGGIAIAQHPGDAPSSEMPERAIEYADPQYVLRTPDIAPCLIQLVNTPHREFAMPNKNATRKRSVTGPNGHRKKLKKTLADIGQPDVNKAVAYSDEGEGTPSVFACPECHGVLWELKNGKIVRFRCRVGHTFGIESLRNEMSAASEAALWAAMRALEEKAALQRRTAENPRSDRETAVRLLDQSVADDSNARIIRDMIFRQDAALRNNDEKLENLEKERARPKTREPKTSGSKVSGSKVKKIA
jgi:two-component system, chemotaxis family, protein-glutamate methylesterase/glutaminase